MYAPTETFLFTPWKWYSYLVFLYLVPIRTYPDRAVQLGSVLSALSRITLHLLLLWWLCSQMLAPPQSLHWLLMRLCSQMRVRPQSLHLLLWRLCWQMLAPPQSLHSLCGGRPRRRMP